MVRLLEGLLTADADAPEGAGLDAWLAEMRRLNTALERIALVLERVTGG